MQSPLCHCGKLRPPRHYYCRECKAAYMRQWRAKRTPSPEQLAKAKARDTAYYAIKRGLLVRTPCVDCAAGKGKGELWMNPLENGAVLATWADYSKPLEVVFLCRFHRARRAGKFY